MSLKRTALTLGIAAAALLGSSIAALAAPAYATSNVNVRSGPGTGYGQVDVLRRGDSVDIDYCRGSWCFVNKSGPDGWVSASYLSRGGYDDDDYYDDDDDFYIDSRPIYRPYRPYRDYYYRPRSSACVGGPNATFCITN
jgi:uncharacterized protein YraI